jgi:6-methylsalicylate decarboxylase
MYLETSSYGNRGVEAVVRVLGIDVITYGSDRPYARPRADFGLGEAAHQAIRVTNPARLLRGDRLPEAEAGPSSGKG